MSILGPGKTRGFILPCLSPTASCGRMTAKGGIAVEMPEYKITGTNVETGRRKTFNIRSFFEDQATIAAVDAGIMPPHEIVIMPPEPATQRQLDYARDLKIPIPMNATKEHLSRLITYATEQDVAFKNVRKPSGKGWHHWSSSMHSLSGQADRQQRAKSSQSVPIVMYPEARACVFASSKEGDYYYTTLETCECADYYSRGLPCKHMYRLAHELGCIDIDNARVQSPLATILLVFSIIMIAAGALLSFAGQYFLGPFFITLGILFMIRRKKRQ